MDPKLRIWIHGKWPCRAINVGCGSFVGLNMRRVRVRPRGDGVYPSKSGVFRVKTMWIDKFSQISLI